MKPGGAADRRIHVCLVTEHTLAELRLLGAGNRERIPTYAEVLDLVAGTGVVLLLDLKVSPALDEAGVIRITERRRALASVIAGVRTLEDLHQMQRLSPSLRTLGCVTSPEEIDAFIAAGVDVVRVWPEWIREDPA